MYKIEDLFDQRSILGAKLEQLLKQKGYTKKQLCEESGVSRPTIDKLIAGTLTSKNNYEKHMEKVMHCLQITPDILLGNANCSKNKVRELRNFINLSTEKMSLYTGISIERLSEIESGATATKAELRDIAVVLSTSTNVLTNEYFFEPQISKIDYLVRAGNTTFMQHVSGYWGHIGVLLKGRKKYIWYPITASTRELVYREANAERIVIPCMNNKVLLLHMENIDEIVLVDDDCSAPVDKDFDSNVSCGEIPFVVYEAVEEYFFDDLFEENSMSEKFKLAMDNLAEEYGWNESDVNSLVRWSILYYTDGKETVSDIDFTISDELVSEVEGIYAYGMTEYEKHVLIYKDMRGEAEVFVNMGNVAMVEMPLLALENAICAMEVDE